MRYSKGSTDKELDNLSISQVRVHCIPREGFFDGRSKWMPAPLYSRHHCASGPLGLSKQQKHIYTLSKVISREGTNIFITRIAKKLIVNDTHQYYTLVIVHGIKRSCRARSKRMDRKIYRHTWTSMCALQRQQVFLGA